MLLAPNQLALPLIAFVANVAMVSTARVTPAVAQPTPVVAVLPTPPVRPSACKATGRILFSSEYRERDGQHVTLTIQTTGTWSSSDGATSKHGCLALDEVDAIRHRLARTSWRDDRRPANCRGGYADRTVVVADRIVYRSGHCHELGLDAAFTIMHIHAVVHGRATVQSVLTNLAEDPAHSPPPGRSSGTRVDSRNRLTMLK